METPRPPDPPLWLSKRFLVAVLLFLCFMNFQILRNNVNITIVEMTSNRSITVGNHTVIQPPDYNWDMITVGFVLSISAYGGLLSFLGGFLVDWLGGAMNGSLCMLIAGFTTLLHPATLDLDFRLFLACRFITGMFESFFYVSTSDIFARWFPKNERSKLISFSLNGPNVGVAVVYPFCGYLAYTWGWQTVFYVTGGISMVAAILFMIIVKNRPSQDKFISKKELEYILEYTEATEVTSMTEINHPYKSILKSGPVWSICIAMFAYLWISTVLGSCLPLYIKDLTQKNTDQIALICSIPNIIFIVTFPTAEIVINFWNNHSNMTISWIHKIMMAFACVSSAIALFVITLVPNFVVVLLLINVIQIVTSFMILIIGVVPVSLTSTSSSVIVGMISVSLSLSAIVSQSVTSFMVINHSLQEWNNCFLLASSILLLTAVIFVRYGSSEPQPWVPPTPRPDSRRPSMINIQFQEGACASVRCLSIQVRRVSLKNSELQNRVRSLSLNNIDIYNRVRRTLTRGNCTDPSKGERKLSLGNFSYCRNKLQSTDLALGNIAEDRVTADDHHFVVPTIECMEIEADESVNRSLPACKSGSEPNLGNLPVPIRDEHARRSSMKSYKSSKEDALDSRRTSTKSVQFEQDLQNFKCCETNTLKCKDENSIR